MTSAVRPRSVVFVGGGPRTVSLIERLAANLQVWPIDGPLTLHVVDPFPPGGGRIWRRDQSQLLWMNSVARDVTMFTDSSVTCAGPIVPGPALDEWVYGEGREILLDAGLREQADSFRPDDFASRELQSHYLAWAFARSVAALPQCVSVQVHATRAVSVTDVVPDQRVELLSGEVLHADVVVLAQGYLDRTLTPEESRLAAAADANDLCYIPPGFTADIDLSGLEAGKPALVRGFGLAFIDVMVLVQQGRGGTFQESADGELEYLPSGREPILYVGSRRGVPYHAKIGYSLGSGVPVPPRYLTPAALAALAPPGEPVDFRAQVWPLIAKELAGAHYSTLFQAHPERTSWSWPDFSDLLETADVLSPEFLSAAEVAVPKAEDRFDLARIDKPFAGQVFADRTALSASVVDYVLSDLHRRADPYYSADAAVFNALLTVYGALIPAISTGRISPADRVRYVEGEFHGLFSFLASGPPPRRLAEMLALHRAGLIQFVGPDMQVSLQDGHFVGSSPAAPGAVQADALLDARLPRPDVRAATDPVISGMLAAGELAAEDLLLDDGVTVIGGQLLADRRCRAVRADGSVHPSRFMLGPSVSGSAGAAGFARPRFNAPGFRQNDAVARDMLALLFPLPAEPIRVLHDKEN